MNIVKVVCFSSLCSLSLPAVAGVINFESEDFCHGSHDNHVIDIHHAFQVSGVSVTFGFDTDADGVVDAPAVIEQSGNKDKGNDTGFWGIGGAKDVAAPGYKQQLGNYFIRQQRPYKPFGVFTILYDSALPVTAASGEIWDIDGNKRNTEQFKVSAFNQNRLLDSVLSPLGNNMALDGKPWTFGFSGLTDITKIEIEFTGSKKSGIGLAFDNFSPIQNRQLLSAVSVPEPNSLFILSLGILAFAGRKSLAFVDKK
ncbi:PEP-CTERM sorting domain-containing protein [Thalassotalea sp. LPB0316]|uniref:PEP-CTERM sorting domain-containing protein n=1 Tax=Thalassotalea sp. LPB0316 TaxID=2769490 RepID=UPI001867B46B|nr:PEP-CTERM sorting domain-containing protein [Thalassotalea sp. LPB0316]QOL26837.1 PEP-CTERM sorting domain-containing protein [Thalassotalea sp. LPB0316]